MTQRTGYTAARAAPHEAALRVLVEKLETLGYEIEELPVHGHDPDLWLPGPAVFVDVKTRHPKHDNITVEIDCFDAWDELTRQGFRVLVTHHSRAGDWYVDDPRSLTARICGVFQPTGNGSLDRWYLIKPGPATPFNKWFGGQ